MKTKIVLVSLTFFLVACNNKSKEVKTVEIKFQQEGSLTISNSENTVLTVFDIEIADNDFERETGLMYRNSMENKQGMLFIFEKEKTLSFYMKNTQISLDILFISAANEIIDIHKNTPPLSRESITSKAPAKYVFEINGGTSERLGITEGMIIDYTQ